MIRPIATTAAALLLAATLTACNGDRDDDCPASGDTFAAMAALPAGRGGSHGSRSSKSKVRPSKAKRYRGHSNRACGDD
ncbi:hypothetical protein [Streptomyces mobaraensis]|uniref:Lipoprotein n=1 Tax=Streptomyces mobaraensis TaxID=35621 RepID=A0A5N5WCX6_STRMB|nr:hypothetical protein [Streptomyces mobaraensis]KAB7850181.1 hypothetical protein FRZ00_06170 [Streptomyces mobaraensis]